MAAGVRRTLEGLGSRLRILSRPLSLRVKKRYFRGWDQGELLVRFPLRLDKEQVSLALDGIIIDNDDKYECYLQEIYKSRVFTNAVVMMPSIARLTCSSSRRSRNRTNCSPLLPSSEIALLQFFFCVDVKRAELRFQIDEESPGKYLMYLYVVWRSPWKNSRSSASMIFSLTPRTNPRTTA